MVKSENKQAIGEPLSLVTDRGKENAGLGLTASREPEDGIGRLRASIAVPGRSQR